MIRWFWSIGMTLRHYPKPSPSCIERYPANLNASSHSHPYPITHVKPNNPYSKFLLEECDDDALEWLQEASICGFSSIEGYP